MNKIQKLTSFFKATSKEVHDAAVAADSSKVKLTFLQQMATSRANHIALKKAMKDKQTHEKKLREARLAEKEEEQDDDEVKAVRNEIEMVAGNV